MDEAASWITTEAAWEAKALAAEVTHQLAELGRLCGEIGCLARAELAISLKEGWEVGFCSGHAVTFAVESPDRIAGLPRRLQPEEPLPGPLTDR